MPLGQCWAVFIRLGLNINNYHATPLNLHIHFLQLFHQLQYSSPSIDIILHFHHCLHLLQSASSTIHIISIHIHCPNLFHQLQSSPSTVTIILHIQQSSSAHLTAINPTIIIHIYHGLYLSSSIMVTINLHIHTCLHLLCQSHSSSL